MDNIQRKEWVKKYMDFMLSNDLENGLALKNKNFPTSFFKYRTLNDYTLESIEYNSLWLAAINSLNDPYECLLLLDNDESLRAFFSDKNFSKNFKDMFGLEISESDIKEIIESEKPYEAYVSFCTIEGIALNVSPPKQIELIQKRWDEIVESGKENIRICSFSERNDSLLMWSHYANQHQGICVEYDFLDDNEFRAFLQPVFYDDKLFKLKTMDHVTGLSQLIGSLVKSKDWEYENEWRLTLLQTVTKKEKIQSSNPKAIYLGPRFKLNNNYKILQLQRICGQHNIPVFQMKIHPTEYKVIVDHEVTL